MSDVGRISEAWGPEARAASAAKRRAKPRCEGGTCYLDALQLQSTLGGDWKLAHGVAVGQGPIKGVRFGHAWVENDQMVIDPSVGAALGKDAYYKQGKIDPKLVTRYTAAEAARKAIETKHSGPWTTYDKDVKFSP